jgi:hypothetical protein
LLTLSSLRNIKISYYIKKLCTERKNNVGSNQEVYGSKQGIETLKIFKDKPNPDSGETKFLRSSERMGPK